MPVHRRTIRFLLFLLFLPIAVAVAGDERGASRAVYCVLRAQPGSDASFRAVLASSLRLRLALRQTALVLDETTDGGTAEGQDAAAAARSRGAAWLMECSYAGTEDVLSFRFELFDAESGRSLGSASGQGKLNLALDSLIVQAIDKTLSGLQALDAGGSAGGGSGAEPAAVGAEPAPGVPSGASSQRPLAVETLVPAVKQAASDRTAGTAPVERASADAGIPASAAEETPRLESVAVVAPAREVVMIPGAGIPEAAAEVPPVLESVSPGAVRRVEPGGASTVAAASETPTAPEETSSTAPTPEAAAGTAPGPATQGPTTSEAAQGPWRLVGISAGAAPFLAVGPISDFTKIGVWSTLAVDFRFPLAGGVLEAGILSGFCWFKASGDVSSADVYLVPIGPDLRFAPEAAASPAFTFHLSGGPAVMTTVTSYLGTIVEAVPYLLGGIAVDFSLAPFCSLRIETEYAAFFEEFSRPIMGFLPGASLGFRF